MNREVALIKGALADLQAAEGLAQEGIHGRRALAGPENLLAALARLLTTFELSFLEHLAMEENRYPRLASCCGPDAERIALALVSEHDGLRRLLSQLRQRSRELSRQQPDDPGRKDSIGAFTQSLNTFLTVAAHHEEKENELLFVIGRSP